MSKATTRRSFAQRFPTRNSVAIVALAENVRTLRKARQLSQEELAAVVEIDQTDVSHIENARANPTVIVLERLAQALDVTLPELFETRSRAKPVRTRA